MSLFANPHRLDGERTPLCCLDGKLECLFKHFQMSRFHNFTISCFQENLGLVYHIVNVRALLLQLRF